MTKSENDASNLSPSNFKLLKMEFKDIISDILDTDMNGDKSVFGYSHNATIIFIDSSRLSICERTEKDSSGFSEQIKYFDYDYYDKNKCKKMGFHSEPHRDKAYRTATEPFHIHFYDQYGHTRKRVSNYHLRDLNAVLEDIRILILLNQNH